MVIYNYLNFNIYRAKRKKLRMKTVNKRKHFEEEKDNGNFYLFYFIETGRVIIKKYKVRNILFKYLE